MFNTETGLSEPRENNIPQNSSFLLEVEGSYEPIHGGVGGGRGAHPPNLHIHLSRRPSLNLNN